MRNWSGHVEFAAAPPAEPMTVGELQALVARSALIHPLGTAHSFNDIADTTGVHVSVAALPGDVDIDARAGLAWIPAGMRYGDAARILDARDLAFHNMASLGHISVGGSVATGTHGSGDRNQTLSAAVEALDLVTAGGDLVTLARGDEDFPGAVVGIGALGVVTRCAIRVEPRFDVRQYVFDDVAHDDLLAGFDEAFSSAYSVSFFTTWSPARRGQVWMKRREHVDAPWTEPTWLGGRLARVDRHPLPDHDTVHCTPQAGVLGPWHERLPHFRLDFTPSSGDELQTEYLVPRTRAVGLLRELDSLADRIAPLLLVSEIRTMAADDLWLSGAYGRDTVGIHFTWRQDDAVLALLPEIDDVLGGGSGRPHWGKLFSTDAVALAARYPRFDDFHLLADRMDPTRKFRNGMLDRLLPG